MNQLKNGKFVISFCTACNKKIWPPYEYCPACYRRTLTVTAGKLGRIVEYTKSWIEETGIIVALIDMGGILLLGSISGGRGIAVGASVELIATGATSDGKIHFHFKTLDRVDSYTMIK